MNTKFSRRDFLKLSMISLGAAYLAACGRAVPPAPTVTLAQPTNTPIPPPTATRVPYVTNEPYAYYDFTDSFEGISDLAANGISSVLNSVKVNSTNYNTLYQTGQQSIEASGTIAGKSGSTLSMEFTAQKLLGSNTYDFSNKVVVIDIYIPADSPIDWIYFEADSGARMAQLYAFKIKDPTTPSLVENAKSYTVSLPKGQWVEAILDIKDVFGGNSNDTLWYAADPNGQLTDVEALEVVKNCDVFKIMGMRHSDGTAGPASFLLDDLRWLERDHIQIDPSADSLREYAAGTHLSVGSYAVYDFLYGILDGKFAQALAQEFNLMEISWKWWEMEPSEGVFEFTEDDAMLDYGAGNHLVVFAYTGADHCYLPNWLANKNFSDLGPILSNYIDTVVRHYRGRIAIWNVFNEVINDAGNGFKNRMDGYTGNTPNGSLWVEGNDPSLIKAAFQQAHIADPQAKLLLNDYYTEEIGRPKSEFFYNFVKELVKEGVPIDAVGFELHIYYPPVSYYMETGIYGTPSILDLPAYLKRVDATIKRFADLGIQVVFSELDVPMLIKDIDTSTAAGQAELKRRLDYEGQIFGGLMKVALDNPNVIAYNTFCYTDRYSDVYTVEWGWTGYGYPDLIDKDYHPKPAYQAVLDVLKT